MLENREPLSRLTEAVKLMPQIEKNLRVTDKSSAAEDAEILAAVDAVRKWLGKSGRLLFRKSGTEDVLRLMAECESDKLCREAIERVEEVIRKRGYIS